MNKLKYIALSSLLALVLPLNGKAIDIGDPNCESLLLVSNFYEDNVKIYDGCSGEYIRNLDSQNLIEGPLGILQAPDGDILVVSEKNSRLLKFDQQTLSQGNVVMGDDPTTTQIEGNFINDPSAAVLDVDGFLYAASFSDNSVVKINTQNWQIVDQILAANNGFIRGIDAGITISEQGEIYLPGFSSNNVIKVNLQTKAVTEVIARKAGGLSGARTIILRNNEIMVTSELSNAIKLYDLATGQFKQNLYTINGPTGMQKDGDDHFIVNNFNSVIRLTNDASSVETIVQPNSGGLTSGTFVYRFTKVVQDSDSDGLTNDDETNIHGTDPNDADTDDDTLNDGDEINLHSSNPLMADSDSDGMPDGFEVLYSLQINVNDGSLDMDSDGLSNFDEYIIGSKPNNSDTDGDGELDGDDSDPLIPNSAPNISGEPQISVEQDQNYLFQPTITYVGDLSTITISIENKPDWMIFDQVSGRLSGLPLNGHVGLWSDLKISTTNGYHYVNTELFDIEVINVNDIPLLVSTIANQKIEIGSTFSLDVSSNFNDIDANDNLIFSAIGLPQGLTITSDGKIQGTASVAEKSTVKVTATDSESTSVTSEFSIEVSEKKSGGGGSQSIWQLLILILIFGGINNKIQKN